VGVGIVLGVFAVDRHIAVMNDHISLGNGDSTFKFGFAGRISTGNSPNFGSSVMLSWARQIAVNKSKREKAISRPDMGEISALKMTPANRL